jgi:hypothetical protein
MRAWSQRNQDCRRNYRDAWPEYRQRNRERQRLRDANGANVDLAKMDVSRENLIDIPAVRPHQQYSTENQGDKIREYAVRLRARPRARGAMDARSCRRSDGDPIRGAAGADGTILHRHFSPSS